MEDFKDRLRFAMSLKGYTAADLSRRSGVGKDALSHYLKGDFLPKQEKIGALAEALGVSPSWLIGFQVSIDGKELKTIDVDKLTDINKAKLEAYYQALLDSQGANNGNT